MSASGLVRNRDFLRLWVASSVSPLGSSLSAIAYPLLVLSFGGSAAEAGAVLSASLITSTVLRLPGGHLADLVDPRKLMVWMDLVRLLVVGSVPATMALGHVSFPQLLMVAAVEGVATALYTPAYSVLLRDIVPQEQLAHALSRFQATTGTIMMAGPPLGGLLFAVAPMLPFVVDAASYAISAAALLTVRTRQQPRAGDVVDRRPTAGVRWLWGHPRFVRLLAVAAVLNLAAAGTEATVLFGLRGAGVSTGTVGLVIACAGVGAVAGSLIAVRLIALLAESVFYVAIALVWAAGTAVFAVAHQPWVIGPVLVLMMLLTPAAGIRLGQLIFASVPRDLVGRVSTATGLVNAGVASVGPALAGILLGAAGLSLTWSLFAALCLLAAGIVVLPGARSAPAPLPQPVAEPDVLAHGEPETS
jgi:predicted MFS family arabinose efflux permease